MKINQIIKTRLRLLEHSKKDFKTIFEIIHHNKEFVFCEKTDGFRIKQTTYGECYNYSYKMGKFLSEKLDNNSEYVGLMMDNSLEFITTFYGILMNNKKPVLINIRLGNTLNNQIIERLNIKDVVCDNDYEINANKIFVKDFNYEEVKQPNTNEFTWANEFAISTSATSLNVKICIYDAYSIATQITNSDYICKTNSMIKTHYNGTLKQLAFLPFYHIFGLMASYFWFSFFGRCFVFLKDLSSDTLLRTIKKHEVTHIFAVPMLWHTVSKQIIKEIEKQDEKTIKKFYKGLKLSTKLQSIFPNMGRKIVANLFKDVREKVFGNSVAFMISGGSYLSKDASYILNGIGYPLFNGYGMSEIGITSVELSKRADVRNKRSIGKPFPSVEYKINENNQLLVKSDGICKKILTMTDETIINHDEYFNTKDIVKLSKHNRYYIKGRSDDVVLTANGEKINPDVIEEIINLPSAEHYCILGIKENNINYLSLIIELRSPLSDIRLKKIKEEVAKLIDLLTKENFTIDKVYYTFNKIVAPTAVKVSRKLLTKWIETNQVVLTPFNELQTNQIDDLDELQQKISEEIKEMFKQALNTEESIDINSHFILDLGATSLDYLTLLIKIEEKYEIKFNQNTEPCYTVLQFTNVIVSKLK